MATDEELCDQIERLRVAQTLSSDPFVRRVLGLAIEALEEAIAVKGEADESQPP